MTPLRTVRWALWGLVAVALCGGATLLLLNQDDTHPQTVAATDPEVTIGGPFSLVTVGDRPFTDADLAGAPFAIYFGFTRCPDVCPTTLYEMSQWIDALGEDASRMRFVFVTVDPERDPPELMVDYVGSFTDAIIPLSGSSAAIAEIVRAYRVYAERIPLDDGDYTMDHTASVFLMDDHGRFVGTISYGEDHESAVRKLHDLVS